MFKKFLHLEKHVLNHTKIIKSDGSRLPYTAKNMLKACLKGKVLLEYDDSKENNS